MGLIPKRHSKLDGAIDKVLLEMTEFGPETTEFNELLRQLERLYELKTNESVFRTVDPNVLVSVLGNFAGIVAILNHERMHVVVSKSMAMVARNKTPTT